MASFSPSRSPQDTSPPPITSAKDYSYHCHSSMREDSSRPQTSIPSSSSRPSPFFHHESPALYNHPNSIAPPQTFRRRQSRFDPMDKQEAEDLNDEPYGDLSSRLPLRRVSEEDSKDRGDGVNLPGIKALFGVAAGISFLANPPPLADQDRSPTHPCLFVRTSRSTAPISVPPISRPPFSLLVFAFDWTNIPLLVILRIALLSRMVGARVQRLLFTSTFRLPQ